MSSLNSMYKNIYFWYFVPIFMLSPALLFPKQCLIVYISAMATVFFSVVLLYKSVILFKKLPGLVSLPSLFFGVFLIAGGSILDMSVTVILSPDLSEEGNPAVLLLLSHNAPLWFIYLLMLFYQILSSTIHIFLFACFLKTYPTIIKTIPYSNFFNTIRWIMGCGKTSFLDFLLFRNVEYDYLMPSLIFITVMSNFTHWYAAMEWLKIIPTVVSSGMLASCAILISFLTVVLITHFMLRYNSQYAIKANGHV